MKLKKYFLNTLNTGVLSTLGCFFLLLKFLRVLSSLFSHCSKRTSTPVFFPYCVCIMFLFFLIAVHKPFLCLTTAGTFFSPPLLLMLLPFFKMSPLKPSAPE